ncbi:uncharacterized protein [Amphiura filiformis]|uniref:uncharacterized protein n=1 Tax=Amphiura filiformis TaxID=82378 RepID=UPI003B20B95D
MESSSQELARDSMSSEDIESMPTLLGQAQSESALPKKSEESKEEGTNFQVGDRVVVKNLDVKQMKRLQKNHGGWDPRMEALMDKDGTILHILPDGDLHVEINFLREPILKDEVMQVEMTAMGMAKCILNPKCVTLVEKSATNFNASENARFRRMPASEMKQEQEKLAEWIPYMERLQGQLCTVLGKMDNKKTLLVKMSSGYMFYVNPNLLEKVDRSVSLEPERCYQRGDIVKIKHMGLEELKTHYKTYGIVFDDNVLNERRNEGEIINVNFGRIIHVYMKSGTILTCCPEILHLVKETTAASEPRDEARELKQEVIIHSLLQSNAEEFPELILPSDTDTPQC